MKTIIFRDNQELQAADFNAVQTFADSALAHALADGVATGRWYAGGDVVGSSATELTVAPARLYQDGTGYLAEAGAVLNLFASLPLAANRIVTVVLWGREIETQVEPRDFLIDPAGDATEPRAVAMQGLREAVIEIVAGAESADPQPPAILPGVLGLADVLLSPTGIVSVTMRTVNRLPSVQQNAQDIGRLNLWKGITDPRVAALGSDLAALAERTGSLPTAQLIFDMAADIARLKERLDLPATYADYGTDKFGTAAKSDPAFAGYNAAVALGLKFPPEAVAYAPVQLFNPIDPSVTRAGDGNTILPAYTEVVRLETQGYVGDLPINQYPAFTVTFTSRVWGEYWQNYGWNWAYYAPWYQRYWQQYYGQDWWWNSDYSYYWSAIQAQQTGSAAAVNGSMVAQTVLVENGLWLTKVGLFLTAISAGVTLDLAIVETTQGKPDPSKTLVRVTVAAAALKLYPVETAVPVGPVYLEGGKRYAIIVMTAGAHRLALVDGGKYTQGTLFQGTDGDYLAGTLNRDLMFRFYAASFAKVRTEVPMQNVSLAGGITDIELKAKAVIPDGTELVYEIQIAGLWKRLGDGLNNLAVKPDIVPLRAVFLGTRDTAPALQLAADGMTASRPATAFTHVSTARTLPAATTTVHVSVWVYGYVEANHDLTCQLVIAGSPVNPTSTVDQSQDGALKRTFKFTGLANITAYQIKLIGARTAGSRPFVVLERTDVAF